MSRRGFSPIVMVLIAAAAAALGLGGYLLVAKKATIQKMSPVAQQPLSAPPPTAPATTSTITTSTTAADIAGWQTYRNEKYGLSFAYPGDLSVFDADVSDSRFSSTISSLKITIGKNKEDAKISLNVACDTSIEDKYAFQDLPAKVLPSDYEKVSGLLLKRVTDMAITVGGFVKDLTINSHKLSVFTQGCYECYDGDPRNGTGGFVAFLFVPGQNRNGNLAVRDLTISTNRENMSSTALQSLKSFFIDKFLPSLKLDSAFNNVNACIGRGEVAG